MTILWTNSISNDRPIEVDTTSSKVYVYIRRNIEKVEVYDEFTKEVYEEWKFEEAKLTSSEYALYMTEKNRSDIDYIMAMTDIE